MARARFSEISKNLLFGAVMTGFVLAAIGGLQSASAATTKYTLKSLSATVNGTSVSATASITASAQTTTQYAGICARNAYDQYDDSYDFDKSTNVVIKTTATTLNGPMRTYEPGTYTYFACIEVKNVWYQVGATQSFTVSTPATTPTDPGTGTGTGTGTGDTTTTPSTVPTGSTYGSNALAQWNTALTNRNTQTATWVAWGDSFTEGQGASTKQNRWVDKTLASLRTKYTTTGVTGGDGYLPGYYATYGNSTWKPYTSAGGSWYWDTWSAALGDRTSVLSPNAYETYTLTGSSFDVLYASGGIFTYKVDSGTAISVNTAGATSATGRVHVNFSSVGTHTVTIKATSGTVNFQGIMAYNGDEAKGIRLYEAAHTGATSGDFTENAVDMSKITAASKADLVTIELGANDFLNGPATPTQVTANLQSMVSAIRQNATTQPSIVIIVPWDFTGNASKLGYTWKQYADAIRAVQTADPSLGLLDLTSVGVADGVHGGGLVDTDGLHPSDAGQAAISTAVLSYLADL